MVSFCYLSFLTLSFFAALSDFVFYRIPNTLIIMILGSVGLKFFLEYPHTDYYLTGLIFLIILLSGYLLYVFKLMGAGDAKFLSASILWLTPQEVPSYLVSVAVSGGILGIFYIFWRHYIDLLRFGLIEKLKESSFFNQPWMLGASLQIPFTSASSDAAWSKTLIPYGISIFIGNLILVYLYFTQRGL